MGYKVQLITFLERIGYKHTKNRGEGGHERLYPGKA
jgi:hypothetical protein